MEITNATPAQPLFIKRTIDGRIYTVLIHFNQTSKETAQDKIRRMLQNDVKNEAFTKSFQTNF